MTTQAAKTSSQPRQTHPLVSYGTSFGAGGVGASILGSTYAHIKRNPDLSRHLLRVRIILLGTTTAFFAAGTGVLPIPALLGEWVHKALDKS